MPRRRSDPTTAPAAVAGEAEEVTAVVHEFVDVHAGDQRGRAFLRADEIDGQEQKEPGEDRPGQDLGQRDARRSDDGRENGVCHGCCSLG
jgi:hypothetical protein